MVLAGCASKAQLASTKSAGEALGLFAKHCAAYGPVKTVRKEEGKPPKLGFGAAIVCEK